jgi:hypothetical protein
MFIAEKYSKKPRSDDDYLGLTEDDFSDIEGRLHREGIVNNVHYDIHTGEKEEKLKVEFINKK